MRGTTFCEIGFLFGTRQESEIEAVQQTTCLVLEKHDFMTIVKQVHTRSHAAMPVPVPLPMSMSIAHVHSPHVHT